MRCTHMKTFVFALKLVSKTHKSFGKVTVTEFIMLSIAGIFACNCFTSSSPFAASPDSLAALSIHSFAF